MNPVPIVGLHIEPTNICTLKCAGCARTHFIQQWPQHWKNHNLDHDDLMRFLDIDLNNVVMHFGGNYGDPIYHPKFLEMVTAAKARGALVSITTNGSYKKPAWWQDLCDRLSSNDEVRFSIDGLPDSFTQYRENADWQSIESGIKVCVAAQIATVWKFIPFGFNQSEIDLARDYANMLGIGRFLIDPSARYDEHTTHLLPAPHLVSPKKIPQDKFKDGQIVPVDPKCSRGREHFITATGHYSPCCHTADHRFYYQTPFGKNKHQFDIRFLRLSQLLEQTDVMEFFHMIDHAPPKVCQFSCPKHMIDQ